MLSPLPSLRILPLASSRHILCSPEQWRSILSRLLLVTHLFPPSALPCSLLGICSRNANVHRAWRQNAEGDSSWGKLSRVVVCGAQRGGDGEGETPGWAVQQPPLRSQLLPQLCLAGDMSQPMERERKHPCLVWSRAKPLVESVGVWMCTWVIFFLSECFQCHSQ